MALYFYLNVCFVGESAAWFEQLSEVLFLEKRQIVFCEIIKSL